MEKNLLSHFAVHPPETRQHCESTILQGFFVFFFLKTLCKKVRRENGREAQADTGKHRSGQNKRKSGEGREKQEVM